MKIGEVYTLKDNATEGGLPIFITLFEIISEAKDKKYRIKILEAIDKIDQPYAALNEYYIIDKYEKVS
jgi:hypothetical protein